jgi:hypothetical protein
VVVDDNGDPAVYGQAVVGLLRDPLRVARLAEAARTEGDRYSLENMAGRFAAGVVEALAVPPLARR